MKPSNLDRLVDRMVNQLERLGLAELASQLLAAQQLRFEFGRALMALEEAGIPRKSQSFFEATRRYNLARQAVTELLSKARQDVNATLGLVTPLTWHPPNRKLRRHQKAKLLKHGSKRAPPYGSFAQVFQPKGRTNRRTSHTRKLGADDGEADPNANPHHLMKGVGVGALGVVLHAGDEAFDDSFGLTIFNMFELVLP